MEKINELTEKLRTFVTERDWDKFHDPKNLSMLLASEVGELVAELRWVANSESDAALASGERRERVEQEIGDVFLSLVMLADRIGIDLFEAAENKLAQVELKYPVSSSYGKYV
jgi:NTP pyrophosphatase (non-canonical NTP hydrolase)